MRKWICLSVAGLAFWAVSGGAIVQRARAGAVEPSSQAGTPRYERSILDTPASKADLEYLGLSGGEKSFVLGQVKAEVLILEVFRMGCHKCHSEAPQINRLFELIKEKGLQDRVKIVSIGMGDSELSVTVYKNKFKIAFPVLPDPNSRIYNIVGRIEIPHVLALKYKEDGTLEKIYSSVSRESSKGDVLLKNILEKAGIE